MNIPVVASASVGCDSRAFVPMRWKMRLAPITIPMHNEDYGADHEPSQVPFPICQRGTPAFRAYTVEISIKIINKFFGAD